MPSLVALLLPPGPGLVEALVRCWDDGDAAAVVDHRLPPAARAAAVRTLAPHRLRSERDEVALDGGAAVRDGDALVVVTSGSTGEPRAAVITHDAVAAAAERTSAQLQVDPATDRWLCCLPLSHVGGLGVVTRALHTGTPLTTTADADAETIAAAASAGATLTALVPTLLARVEPGAFRRILLGGAAPPRTLSSNVVTTWGLTETYGGVVYDGTPLPGVEVRCEGEELLVRTPTVARTWRDGTDVVDRDGWLHTGDGGVVRSDGTVVVHGRLAEVINTGGEKVWPAAVEAALATHPDVAEVAVLGLVDDTWGHRVHAIVVPVDAALPPSLASLREHVGSVLPPWCAPRSCSVAAALPRTALGKVRRGELRAPRGAGSS